MIRLCQESSERSFNVVVNHAFWQDRCLQDDDCSRHFLEAIAEAAVQRPPIESYNLAKALVDYSSIDPSLTLKVCQAKVEGYKTCKEDDRINLDMSEAELVRIALTLHRSPEQEIRKQALDLFEDLCDLQAYTAINSLKRLDFRGRENDS